MLFLLLFSFLGKVKGLERSHTTVNTQHPKSGRDAVEMLGKELCGQLYLTDLGSGDLEQTACPLLACFFCKWTQQVPPVQG